MGTNGKAPDLKWSWTYGTRDSAHTPFGSYYVERDGSGFRWGYCFDEYHDEDNFGCDSIKDGKAAAQKDWNERTGEMFAEATAPLLAGLRTIVKKMEWGQPNEALKRAKALLAKHGGAE